MKEISDKEFDGFFKSFFEDFEVEPSAKSWEEISNNLAQKTEKRRFPLIWTAAASVMIIIAIGIRFYLQPAEMIKLKGNQAAEQVLASAPSTSSSALPKEEISSVSKSNETLRKKENATQKERSQQVNQEQQLASITPEKNISPDATTHSSSSVLNTKAVDQNLAEVNEVQPVKVKTVTERILAEEAAQKNNEKLKPTEVLAQSLNGNPIEDGAISGKKVKIRSVGDLVNFVIAKVDKRNEKIIEVSKTDESDNEITGINLGLIKFRKAEK
ncbi:MAG: hypothetical protein IE931_00995 [Sphingobacteriales bacterium]|nr:hypothetical protein [Sphingobacteriales bacterium]